ncbi:flap endonuclease 1 [Striga asiatica]|uniref:Flap endonuclease 1 n=1 Tax=Striga asiatica TaxID=4170 RepID=A0A5A7PPX2_STRAF|nr:flap endonuclease 1 [Striga asiatica]
MCLVLAVLILWCCLSCYVFAITGGNRKEKGPVTTNLGADEKNRDTVKDQTCSVAEVAGDQTLVARIGEKRHTNSTSRRPSSMAKTTDNVHEGGTCKTNESTVSTRVVDDQTKKDGDIAVDTNIGVDVAGVGGVQDEVAVAEQVDGCETGGNANNIGVTQGVGVASDDGLAVNTRPKRQTNATSAIKSPFKERLVDENSKLDAKEKMAVNWVMKNHLAWEMSYVVFSYVAFWVLDIFLNDDGFVA